MTTACRAHCLEVSVLWNQKLSYLGTSGLLDHGAHLILHHSLLTASASEESEQLSLRGFASAFAIPRFPREVSGRPLALQPAFVD